jgi:hypothetical protein
MSSFVYALVYDLHALVLNSHASATVLVMIMMFALLALQLQ